MTLIDISSETLGRSDLQLFHEMSPDQRAASWRSAQPYLRHEEKVFEGIEPFTDLTAARHGIRRGLLVPVYSQEQTFGIVAPIRSRHSLPTNEKEGSIPYLQPHTAAVFYDFMADTRRAVMADEACVEELSRGGFRSLRLSACSFTRVTGYQTHIAAQGRPASGYDGRPRTSVHEAGKGFDVDHGAVYATRNSGQEIPLNRDAAPEDAAILYRLLPPLRAAMRAAISIYQQDGTVMALEEIPTGWGVWHVAVPEAA